MRSMYAGVAGLKTHQTKFDVLGNNVANVNTFGFKSSTVVFSDLLYQTTQNATAPNPTTGTAGTNAIQIGLGSNVQSVTTAMSRPGGAQSTGNSLDVMINGGSFFIVNNGSGNLFTKNGAFTVDANGTLCTTSGYKVMGWQVDTEDKSKIKTDAVSALNVMSADKLTVPPESTKEAYLKGNIDKNDSLLTGTGKNFQVSFYDNLGQNYTAKFVTTQVASEDGNGNNVYKIQLYDVYDSNNKSVFITSNKSDGETTYAASSLSGGFGVIESGGTYEDIDMQQLGEGVNEATGKLTDEARAEFPSMYLVFDSASGKFRGISNDEGGEILINEATGESINKATLRLGTDDGESPFPLEGLNIDFSQLTMYDSDGNSTITSKRGDLGGLNGGKKFGAMTGLSIDQTGKIYGAYDNGDSVLLGQVAVASFPNASGLEAVGGSLFQSTQNSGEFDGVGIDVTSDGGSFSTGVLEMSNVDLAQQFTEIITTQRGFQANSKIITTADTLLEELISLKR